MRAAAITLAIVLSLLLSPVLIFGASDVTDGTGVIRILIDPFALAFQSAAAAVVLAAVWILGWGRDTTLIATSDRPGLRLAAWFLGPILALYAIVTVLALASPGYSDIVLRVLMTLGFSLAVGVTEEVLYRGVLMHGLRSRFSPGRALVICSIVFAISHSVNALWGQSPLLTAQQIGFTFTFGALLGAIALQTASLWPAIVLHGIWDAVIIGGQLIDGQTPPADPSNQTTLPTGGSASPDIVTAVSTAAGALIFIALIGVLALVVYRRWRRRTAGSAGRRA